MSIVIRATLADQAYRELRSRILAGRLAGGQRLLSEELAEQLTISPTPIKEALVRLEAEGLVVSLQRKGAMVRRFTEEDVAELYEARLLIERDAVARAFTHGRIVPALIDDLNDSLEQHELYARRDTLDDLGTALVFDRKFHQQIMIAGGNSVITEWHMRILSHTHTVFVYNAGDYARSVDEHRAVLDALSAGSCAGAQEALERHLLRSRENTLRNVRKMTTGELAEA